MIGGAPLRILRLSERGRRWLDDIESGGEIPTGSASADLARRLVDGGLASPVPPQRDGPASSEVALVIPVRDDPDGLARTLATVGPVGRVVVVDDGSVDRAAIERAAGAGVTVIRHERCLGPAAARETGRQACDAAYIAFVDAEVEASPGWLDELLAHFADPTVGAVAPRVRSMAGRAPGWLASYEAVRSSLDLGPVPSGVRPGSRVPYVPTAALVVRREALDAIDGFDTTMRVGEDVDLVWRMHQAGWRLRYEPAVHVTHPSRPSLGTWVRQRFTYGTSAADLAARHGRAVAPLLGVSGWSALAWGAVVAGHPVAGVAVAAGTTAALVPKLRTLEDPTGEAVRIAGTGNLWAGRRVADVLRRAWWPLTLVLGFLRSRTRPAIAAALVIPPLLEWREARPALDPGRFALLHLLDDVAYGAGVWAGSVRARSARALLPSFTGPLEAPSAPIAMDGADPTDA